LLCFKDAGSLLDHGFMTPLKEYMKSMVNGDEATLSAKVKRWHRMGPSRVARDADGNVFARVSGFTRSRGGRKGRDEPQFMSEKSLVVLDGMHEHPVLGVKNLGTFRAKKHPSIFCLPPQTDAGLTASMRANIAKQKGRDANWSQFYSKPDFQKRLDDFVSKYTPALSGWGNTGDATLQFFEEILDSMDGTRSTGASSYYHPGPKSTWQQSTELRTKLWEFTVCRLAQRMALYSSLPTLSPMEMIESGLKDPEVAVVKDEAHKEKKILSEAWRIIWVGSLLDLMCQNLVHHHQNKQDIKDYQSGSLNVQAVGLGHHDDGIKRVGEMLDAMQDDPSSPKQIVDQDAEGWDWSVRRDDIMFDTHRRHVLYSRTGECADEPSRGALFLAVLTAEGFCNSIHVLNIGETLWEMTVFGITASGIASTSAQNSPIRSFTAMLCGMTNACAAGDDLVGVGEVDEGLMKSTGIIPKETNYVKPTGPIEFTSHKFSKVDGTWTAEFMNLAKMVAHLDLKSTEEVPPSTDCLAGCAFCLRHDKKALGTLSTYVRNMGWGSIPAPKESTALYELF
jgi:hypothetical protein